MQRKLLGKDGNFLFGNVIVQHVLMVHYHFSLGESNRVGENLRRGIKAGSSFVSFVDFVKYFQL